jgi:hypothetical protein
MGTSGKNTSRRPKKCSIAQQAQVLEAQAARSHTKSNKENNRPNNSNPAKKTIQAQLRITTVDLKAAELLLKQSQHDAALIQMTLTCTNSRLIQTETTLRQVRD